MSQPSLARTLLLPLVPVYRLLQWLQEKRLGTRAEPVRRLRFPVVSVGNLSVGGTGKTPLTITLARALTRRGMKVDVLSRGYGRADKHTDRVDPSGTAEEFGDEPLLIARETGVSVYVASQRYEAGVLAEGDAVAIAALGEEPELVVHLLDDGFQHRQLARDVDILLLDRQDWTGGLLPAGNLREPLKAARRAGVIAIPADDPELESELRVWGWEGPVWQIQRQMDVPVVDGPIGAFCGIARPDQFLAGLAAAGLQLAVHKVFPDHHRYSARDVDRLVAGARAVSAVAMLTTEKDLVRLGSLASSFTGVLALKTVRLRVEIDRQDEAIDGLMGHLKPAPLRQRL